MQVTLNNLHANFRLLSVSSLASRLYDGIHAYKMVAIAVAVVFAAGDAFVSLKYRFIVTITY